MRPTDSYPDRFACIDCRASAAVDQDRCRECAREHRAIRRAVLRANGERYAPRTLARHSF